MEEKFCNGCQLNKSLICFAKKRNGLQSRCRDCQNLYHKQHYKDNIEGYKKRAKINGKKKLENIRQFIRDQKNKPCQDCKIKYPYYVMDFDHRPDEIKNFNLADIARLQPRLEIIVEEINKCDIVCSNCHRIRTHSRTKTRYPSG